MTSNLVKSLLDFAEWVAPAHRRGWIDALRAEAEVTPAPLAWACGAVSTALRQRLADALVTGEAARLAGGGFILFVAAGFAVFIAVRVPNMLAIANARHMDVLPELLATGAFIGLLFTGGVAILMSGGRPWINRYGRLLFAFNAAWFGLNLIQGPYRRAGHAATALQHQMAWLNQITGPFYIAAAMALAFRWPRLFLPLALGALFMQVASCLWQWGNEPPHLPDLTTLATALFVVTANALMLLAAGGLIAGPKRPARAC